MHEVVQHIRTHPLVPGDIPINGHIHDVKRGTLDEGPSATEAGRVR